MPRIERMKAYAQFQAVMGHGSMCARTSHFALHRLNLDEAACLGVCALFAPAQQPRVLRGVLGQIWMGPLVSKRWARRSVTRHAIRRQIYAVGLEWLPRLLDYSLRQSEQDLYFGTAYVVRLRSGFDSKAFPSACSDALKHAVRTQLHKLFERSMRPSSPNMFVNNPKALARSQFTQADAGGGAVS